MPASKTLASISAPRIHPVTSIPTAPLTQQEKKEKRQASKEKQEEIDEAVGAFFSYAFALATQLAEKFEKKERYFLDIFFQGGAHMVNHQEKVNPYNAFKSIKAAELREAGEKGLAVEELHETYKDEYNALSEEEKAEIVKTFSEIKSDAAHIRRDTPRARIRDVSNTVRNIQMLLHGLSYRVGIEAIFCIVRNNPDFYMAPQWYFTSPEVERYMPLAVGRKWDTAQVGTRIEAFAVAGCNTMNLLRTTKQKVDFVKAEIRDSILAGLVAITQKDDIRMDYLYYEESIVLKYGVELVGWTADRFVNPSELSSSLAVLTTLRDAICNGDCKWVHLTPDQRATRNAKWKADVAAGKVIARQRSTRSDKGKKRKAAGSDEEEDDDNAATATLVPVPASVTPIVEEPETTTSNTDAIAPVPKRRKTAAMTAARKAAVRNGGSNQGHGGASKENRPPARKGKGQRDDEATRKAITQMRRRRAATSRAVVSSDEEDNAQPAPAF